MRRSMLLTLLVLLGLCACSHVPVTSLLKLSQIDLSTTDPAQLRVAVKLPEALRPLPRSMVLRVMARRKEGPDLVEGFALREVTALAEGPPLQSEAEPGTRIAVYGIDPAALPHVAAFRAQASAQGAKGGGLALEPQACRTGALPSGPLLISTYLRTVETGGYIPLTSGIDLRTVAPGRDVAAAIPPCE